MSIIRIVFPTFNLVREKNAEKNYYANVSIFYTLRIIGDEFYRTFSEEYYEHFEFSNDSGNC